MLLIYSSMCHTFYMLCFKQNTAYEMRISDWSSDVCSSDLKPIAEEHLMPGRVAVRRRRRPRARQRRIGSADWKCVVSGKSVSVRVDLGGRRIINKQQTKPASY